MTDDELRQALRERRRADFDFRSLPMPPPGGLKHGSVMVPLAAVEGATRVLLTRRHSRLRRHPGQWSFPGGRVDDGEDSYAAALREAQEEIALDPAEVDMLGTLDETLVLASPFRLTPWVARVPYPYPYLARPGEVDDIRLVPLEALTRPGAHHTEVLEAYGTSHVVNFYEVGEVLLFGATAHILTQLLGVWRGP